MENKSKAETAQINFWHLATEDNFSQKYSIQNKSVLKGRPNHLTFAKQNIYLDLVPDETEQLSNVLDIF